MACCIASRFAAEAPAMATTRDTVIDRAPRADAPDDLDRDIAGFSAQDPEFRRLYEAAVERRRAQRERRGLLAPRSHGARVLARALNRYSGGIYMPHAEDHVGFICALV